MAAPSTKAQFIKLQFSEPTYCCVQIMSMTTSPQHMISSDFGKLEYNIYKKN
ncbi:hypothetical protein OIU77_018617 [Salix suchowensis]|uniref:Uncharacterized protein n=1 Tax=Salix suchowensis TaxID=1278906 RepID=A0ABQ9CD87_9ROSI|nr:hypothetical protein OIU77_018617 [Salix suchowensis]